MKICRLAFFAAVLFFVGCLPIELDVSRDGRVLIPRQEGFFSLDLQKGKMQKLYTPREGAPVFARYAPDGKSILAVVNINDSFSFRIISLPDGSEQEILNATNAVYTRYSPNGRYIAITRVADSQKPPITENMPELHMIQASDGLGKVAAYNIGSHIRWMPDSRRILVFQIDRKNDKRQLFGNLVLIDVGSGAKKVIAAAAGTSNTFFDISPDGKKVLLIALNAGAPKAELKVGDEDKTKVFEVDVAKSSVRATDKTMEFAIWSPDGKKVLMGGAEKNGAQTLEVADAQFKGSVTVATDAAGKAAGGMGMGADTMIYPGWLDSRTLFYLARKAVYGTAGVNLAFVTVSADGKERKLQQTLIDQEAAK